MSNPLVYLRRIAAAAMVTAAVTGTASAQEVLFPATPASLGPIPDGLASSAYAPGLPRDVTFQVTGIGAVETVSVTMAFNPAHTWGGDVTATLIAPDGTSHVIFGRRNVNTANGAGSDANLAGPYTFSDRGVLNFWLATSDPVAPGSYRTVASGGPFAIGTQTVMDPVFRGHAGNGTWTLRVVDGHLQDTGAVSAASLTLSAIPLPTGVADTYSTAYATPLRVPGPGVLRNDINPPTTGTMTAVLDALPHGGNLALQADGGFSYTPSTGFVGVDTFTYRPVNQGGSGPVTTVSIAVPAPTTTQPATRFRVDRVSGNQVTLRWAPPVVGPAPVGYVVEGGLTPGTTVGSLVLGRAPFVRFAAPQGSYFLRVRSISAAGLSSVSNEAPLFVGVPVPPLAPTHMTAAAVGNALTLNWKLSYGGGTPAAVMLEIGGAATGSVPVGLAESFSFSGVPAGTYIFSVRASNAAGVSPASPVAQVTFPGGCTVPAVPTDFQVFEVDGTAFLVWDPPVTGAAPTGYQITATGAVSGTFPVGSVRELSSAVPSGIYALSVAATNPCGAGPATAVQTLVVP